jgi:hypothetical protein
MTIAFVILAGGVGTLIGPEGTIGAAAWAAATGDVLLCGLETAAEVNYEVGVMNAARDQRLGETIPVILPPRYVPVPYQPAPPGPPQNPNFGPEHPHGEPPESASGAEKLLYLLLAAAIGGGLISGSGEK